MFVIIWEYKLRPERCRHVVVLCSRSLRENDQCRLGALDTLIRLRFDIIDTGCGISPSVLSTLFRPFQQADLSTARRHGGAGLGLAISRELMSLMGGTMNLQSVEGQGTTMTVEIGLEKEVSGADNEASDPDAYTQYRSLVNLLSIHFRDINLLTGVEPHTARFAVQLPHRTRRPSAGPTQALCSVAGAAYSASCVQEYRNPKPIPKDPEQATWYLCKAVLGGHCRGVRESKPTV